MSEFTPIETQEAFDAAIRARLERQKNTLTEELTRRYEGYAAPDAVAALQGQIDALSKDKDTLTAQNASLTRQALRQRIAYETGLPFALADRLSGDTEEEIRSDARTMAQYTGTGQSTPRYQSEQPADSRKTALMDVLHQLNQS